MAYADQFNALHKTVFGKDGVPNLIPDIAMVQKDIAFRDGVVMGDYFEETVRLALPGGFTRKKGDGTAGIFTMNGAKGGVSKKVKVYGYQMTLQDQIAYEDLSKAAKAGPRAFKAASVFFWEGLQLSMRKMLEIMAIYGNKGIGVVDSYSASNANYGNQPTITIKVGEWAPMIWGGYEGATISVMNGSTSAERGEADIVSVDIEKRVIVLSATVTSAAQNDVIYWKDGYGAEMEGLYDIFTNTGTKFNIDAGTYSLWKVGNHAVNGKFSFQALKTGLQKSMQKGNMYNMNIYASTGGVDDLIGSIHQLRSTDKTEIKKIELGADQVVYKFAGITATVKAHPMVKNGHAFGVVPQFASRVGSADIGYGMPGHNDEKVWFDLEQKAGIEGRMYTHQQIFTEMPGVNMLWTGIVNSVS